MKINGTTVGQGPQGIESSKSKSATTSTDNKNLSADLDIAKSASAKVNVSDRAQMMQKAKDIAMNSSDVNESRVAELQKLIDSGKYKVDAEGVADRLVDTHLLFPD